MQACLFLSLLPNDTCTAHISCERINSPLTEYMGPSQSERHLRMCLLLQPTLWSYIQRAAA